MYVSRLGKLNLAAALFTVPLYLASGKCYLAKSAMPADFNSVWARLQRLS
jgi:hypothetical protein